MSSSEPRLPSLRQDLRLYTASPDEDGAPRWQLHDPLTGRYFYFSDTAFHLFRHWQAGLLQSQFVEVIQQKVQHLSVTTEDIKGFIRFLHQNHLTRAETYSASQELLQRYLATRKSWFSWLLHNYLFIKLPLFRPDAFLDRIFPQLQWIFKPWIAGLCLALGALGLLLVLRQWSDFITSFEYFFSWQGLAAYGVALVLVKSAHELGHAMVAKRYQCRVSSMGIAFLVLFPILYTDTTDAWKLRSKYQRLNIVTAGVRVELYIAMVATFFWVLLPDGGLRSALFFVATTSWVSSLLINISPFMRFDGYYALSDLTGVENLQPRAFSVGRWYLRRQLFGFDDPPPEPLNPRKKLFFISYAWGTWIYRFFLFLGIALLVYHFAFKVLGILLFIVEILWFVLLPVGREIKVWWNMKQKINWNPASIRTLIILTCLLAVLIIPWQQSISLPAVIKTSQYTTLYAPEAGEVYHFNIQLGDSVKQGDLLIALTSPVLEHDIVKSQLNIDQLYERLRRTTSSQDDREAIQILQQALVREQGNLASLLHRRERLMIRAPFSGKITDMYSMKVGDTFSNTTPLLSLIDSTQVEVHGFISANDMQGLKIAATGTFTSNSGYKFKMLFNQVKQLPFTHQSLPFPELASTYGGRIATRIQNDQLIPEAAYYEVILTPEEPLELTQRMAGVIIMEGKPTPLLEKFLKRIYALLIRESSF